MKILYYFLGVIGTVMFVLAINHTKEISFIKELLLSAPFYYWMLWTADKLFDK